MARLSWSRSAIHRHLPELCPTPVHNLNSQLVYSEYSVLKAARATGFAADFKGASSAQLNLAGPPNRRQTSLSVRRY